MRRGLLGRWPPPRELWRCESCAPEPIPSDGFFPFQNRRPGSRNGVFTPVLRKFELFSGSLHRLFMTPSKVNSPQCKWVRSDFLPVRGTPSPHFTVKLWNCDGIALRLRNRPAQSHSPRCRRPKRIASSRRDRQRAAACNPAVKFQRSLRVLYARFHRALRGLSAHVDSRTTNSGRIGTESGKVACPRIRCSRMRAATTPI